MNINLEFHIPNSQVYASLFIILALIIVSIIVGIRVKKLDPKGKTPAWLVPFLMIVDFINNLTKESFGRRWKPYAPYLLALMSFVFFANISGVVGLATPTSYIVIDACLAIISFFVIQITGMISQGPKGYLKGFIDPIPLMLPINIISELTLPISLALRIMGNIMSGAVIGSIVKGLVGINGWLAFIIIPGTVIVNLIFDLFSGIIQTLVFVYLTTIFASMKVNPKDLEDEKEIKEIEGELV